MIIWAIIINYSMLIGVMIFFVAVVSPSAISTLEGDYLASFLRAIFPKMFLLGLVLGIAGNMTIYSINQPFILFWSGVITLSFAINLLFLTPKINSIRDNLQLDEGIRETRFKIYHGLSVVLFMLNFVLSLFIVAAQIWPASL